MKGVSVIIPTLNEEAGIESVVLAVPRRVARMPVEIIVVDGNSTDRTRELAEKAGARVLSQKTRGKGAAIAEALPFVSYDFVVILDGDGTYDPAALLNLVLPVANGTADMAVASRKKDGRFSRVPFFNTIGNRLFNAITSRVFEQKITDMLSGYRAIRKDTLERLNLVSRGFEFETELTVEALRRGLKILEVPTAYKARKGKSKLSPFRDGFRIAKTLLLLVRDTNPLLFFGSFSTLFFVASIYPAALVFYEKLTTDKVAHLASTVLATALFLLGALLLALGLLADMQLVSSMRLEKLVASTRFNKKKR